MIIDELISGFFQEVILGLTPKLGAVVRWIFLHKKYSYKEILKQNWNNRIGCLILAILIGGIIFFVNY